MAKIYAMGTMRVNLTDNPSKFIESQRLWFLFSDFDTAEKAVLSNEFDIFEYYYNIALIEEIELLPVTDPKALYTSNNQWWYSAAYKDNFNQIYDYNLEIKKIPKPMTVENLVNFWVG